MFIFNSIRIHDVEKIKINQFQHQSVDHKSLNKIMIM